MPGASTEDVAVRLRVDKGSKFRSEMGASGKSIRGFGKDVSSASRTMKLANGVHSKFASGLSAVGGAAKLGAGIGIFALGGIVRNSIKDWKEHLGVTRRTAAVIESTGHAARVSAKHVANLTDALETQTGMDNDVIQGGANMLLTFTNIRNGVGKTNKIFDEATKTTVGMAQALGTDPKQAALQLGKALNDPAKGLTKLQRIGVTFTDQQKKQVEALVKSGDTMAAQRIILKELNKEFPRVKATPFQRLATTIRNLGDELGQKLNPLVNKGARALNKFITQADKGTGAGGRFVSKAKAIGIAINTYLIQPIAKAVQWIAKSNDRVTAVAIGLGVLTVAMIGFSIATAIAAAPVYLVIAGIALLSAGLYYAYQRSETFRNIVNALFSALKATAQWIVTAGVNAFNWLKTAIHNVSGVVSGVKDRLSSLVGFVKGLPGRINSAASGMWDGIKNAFKSSINWIIGKWNSLDFTIPSVDTHIPGVGHVGGFSLGTPDIPMLAKGGNITRAGSVVVGDRGPELLHLDRGAQVQPLANGQGGDTYVFLDSEPIAARIEHNVKRKARHR